MFALLALILLFVTAVVSKVVFVCDDPLVCGMKILELQSYMCILYKEINLCILGCMLKNFVTARSA